MDPVAQLAEAITTWLATAFGWNLSAADQIALVDLITNSALYVQAERSETPPTEATPATVELPQTGWINRSTD
jgi:hypothetical protein